MGLELSTSAGPLAGEGERWRSVGGGEGGGGLHPEVGWATWESQPYTLCPWERPARPVASAPVEERWGAEGAGVGQSRVQARRRRWLCSLEGWKAARGTRRELKPQQLRTKFILNHTPRSSQLIAELETIRELPNYCQLERTNQAPVSHTPPGAHH